MPALLRLREGLTLVILLTCSGCASSSTAYNGPATTAARQAIETWTEELRSGPGFRILLRNNTREAVRITTIQLYDCQNINQTCASFDPGIVLAPGQTTEAMTIGPSLPNYEFTFQYRFSWRSAR